ncbi:MAG: sigma-54-dependent transcriptional regulator [Desulfohalobiaceae bacterium]
MDLERMHNAKIVIVEDDEGLGGLLVEEVLDAGHEARLAKSGEEALAVLQSWPADVVVCDLWLPGMDGLQVMETIRSQATGLAPSFLIITAFGTIPKAVEALKAGADDFLTKPLDLERFMLCIRRLLETRRLREELARFRDLLDMNDFHGMFGRSRPMLLLFDQIRQVAKSNGPVLIVGESGVGKEMVAGAIHRESPRRDNTFLAVNCPGIPENLIESEFFGHTAGSFTGASQKRAGLFLEADQGSLLLDEIAEMPLSLQPKLLRILQDGKVRPVGSDKEVAVDTRVLAATNRDLEEEVREGRFRKDLFYRLEAFTLRVPPLRDRGEDIELLAAHLLNRSGIRMGKKGIGFSDQVLRLLQSYPFPGNVRELENAMERAATFCDGKSVQIRDLPVRMRTLQTDTAHHEPASVQHGTGESLAPLAEVEQRYIQHVLSRVNGNKRRAAEILGVSRRTLYRKLETEKA